MTVFLSDRQLLILGRVKSFFRNRIDNGKVRSMFRESGADMSVGLSYTEDGQSFIVRETIPAFASSALTDAMCARLLYLLGESYRNVTGIRPYWAE